MVRIGPNTDLDETTWNSPNYTAAGNVPAAFGMRREIKGITIHHWGAEGQRFENVCNFLSRPGGTTSAHFVVEGGRAACLISPAHAAWHSGSAVGNATTIGIECRPEMTAADFTSLVELVAYLESVYGELSIYGHKDFFNTACPGKYYPELANLVKRVNEAKKGVAITPANVKSESNEGDWLSMATAEDVYKQVTKAINDAFTPGRAGEKVAGTPYLHLARIEEKVDKVQDRLNIVWGGIFTDFSYSGQPGTNEPGVIKLLKANAETAVGLNEKLEALGAVAANGGVVTTAAVSKVTGIDESKLRAILHEELSLLSITKKGA